MGKRLEKEQLIFYTHPFRRVAKNRLQSGSFLLQWYISLAFRGGLSYENNPYLELILI